MATRLQLQTKLEEILDSRNVYFQPPENLQMKYPCIVYEPDYETRYADNDPYSILRQYQLEYIDRNPESSTVEKLLKLRTCKFDRLFVYDGLYHYVYRIYY